MSRNLGQAQERALEPVLKPVDEVQSDHRSAPERSSRRLAHDLRNAEFPRAASAADLPVQPELRFASARPEGAFYRCCKRAFDIAAGSVLLLITLPIVLAAAVWIRAESEGSPFFFQTRLGRNGKPFKIFKLRGMYVDARERFPELYDYSHNRDLDFHFHYSSDPRVTSAGRFLRRASIDELPNLWNVLIGDMSLVGPRPEIPDILAMYGPYRDAYLSVKPGITCRSKITGRDALTKRESIEFDLQYIRNQGFAEDFFILWETARNVLSRRDVY
jgi:lipopolysaccharide/colanic/teichoic acid biosynthesis glycosyltransferase